MAEDNSRGRWMNLPEDVVLKFHHQDQEGYDLS